MTGDPWADAAAVVGSVAIIAGTVIKVFGRKKKPAPEPEPTFGRRVDDLADLDKRVALNEQGHKNLEKKVDDIQTTMERNHIKQEDNTRRLFDKMDELKDIIIRNGNGSTRRGRD